MHAVAKYCRSRRSLAFLSDIPVGNTRESCVNDDSRRVSWQFDMARTLRSVIHQPVRMPCKEGRRRGHPVRKLSFLSQTYFSFLIPRDIGQQSTVYTMGKCVSQRRMKMTRACLRNIELPNYLIGNRPCVLTL